jgi:hypothetical protein
MGLDMYLNKKIYVGGHYDHRNAKGSVDITVGDFEIKLDATEVGEISCQVGYWRKANAIHQWFVENVQDGKDDCEEYYVAYSKLRALYDVCEKVLQTRDPEPLPPQAGFFFGSTEIDEGYYSDLVETMVIIEKLDPKAVYYYQSSW